MKRNKVKRIAVKISCDTSECMKSLDEVEKRINHLKEMEEQISKSGTSREDVISALAEFVIRVSKGKATPAEVAVLPEVAKIIMPMGLLKEGNEKLSQSVNNVHEELLEKRVTNLERKSIAKTFSYGEVDLKRLVVLLPRMIEDYCSKYSSKASSNSESK